MKTGFEYRNNQLTIDKDPEASLTYTLDWSEWLEVNDIISMAEFSIQARSNDPAPLINADSGIVDGTKTYINVEGGQLYKLYTVSVKVTTSNGLIDKRNFKVNVMHRSA